jgi:hypothetical protein
MTAEQRRETLQKAAAARRERTRALAKLKDGSVTITAVLDDKENPLQRAFVRQVLRALPRIGAVTADKIGARQREALTAALA